MNFLISFTLNSLFTPIFWERIYPVKREFGVLCNDKQLKIISPKCNILFLKKKFFNSWNNKLRLLKNGGVKGGTNWKKKISWKIHGQTCYSTIKLQIISVNTFQGIFYIKYYMPRNIKWCLKKLLTCEMISSIYI